MPTYLFAMVSATVVFSPRRLLLVTVDNIGVFEYVADAHGDTLAGGGNTEARTIIEAGTREQIKWLTETLLLFWNGMNATRKF